RDARHTLDPLFMLTFPLLEQRGRIPPAVLLLVDLPVAVVTEEQEIVDAVQHLLGNALVAARAAVARRPDVSAFRDVDLFLGHRRLPERSVAVIELAASSGPSPQHPVDRLR